MKPAVAVPTCGPVHIPALDPHVFSQPTKITSQWMPLVPGTRMVLEGRANRGGGVLPHRITFTVTDLTKVIDGVPNLVTWDVDTDKNTVSEAELAFFAQDDGGNVWNFGEYPEEYQGGKFTGAPSTWIAGLSRAEAGIQVPAKVQIGTPEVLQGSSPDVDFLDCAKDVKATDRTCVPVGCYDQVRVVDERSPLAPDSGVQRKSYAPGIGNVRVEAVGDPEGETLVLVERTTLSPADLAKARAETRKLDEHGRATHPVYKDSAPLQGP
ncbi:hypothetical protein [Amycolatopsis sp. NPDC021455]|uniref:hypothetical protein n=1 Tax=Amycolatopsis sp. NPDC021455 TaxID=3154901 RepID=UPI003407381C